MTKCLVIDDVEVTRFATTQFLNDLGVEVVTAENGKTAMTFLGSQPVDIVLLDWHLGPDSGLDLLKDIRQKMGARLPVVVFSGVESEAKSSEALSAGANAFLEKPTTREKLERCFKNLGIPCKAA